MESSFDRLLELAPPPATPVKAGSPEHWGEVENTLGTALPADYKRFINTYGSGDFCDLLGILNPFASRSQNLLSMMDPMLEEYREGRRWMPEQCPCNRSQAGLDRCRVGE